MYHGRDTRTGMRRHRRERWLHARISGGLEEALKREARRRRSPVSLVVRNVLEGALDVVEGIVEDGLGIAAGGRRAAPDDDIYGWQELLLNRAAACARCAARLGTGATAYRGLSDRPGPPVFLCLDCVRRMRRPAGAKEVSS